MQGSFADAEVAEDHVQDVLDIDPAGQPPQRAGGDAELFGQQILAAGERGLASPPQGRQGILQGAPMPLAGDQRWLGAGQEDFGMPGQGGQQGFKPFSCRARKIEYEFTRCELILTTSC